MILKPYAQKKISMAAKVPVSEEQQCVGAKKKSASELDTIWGDVSIEIIFCSSANG